MSAITCPSCNTVAPAGAVFCDNCGYDLRNVAAPAPAPVAAAVSEGETCPSCGHANVAGAAFCENCGAQLKITSTSPAAPAPQPEAPAPMAAAPEPQFVPPPQPVASPTPPPAPLPAQPAAPVSELTGRLLVQRTNTSLPLPSGKQVAVIGREDPVSGIFPAIDLDPFGAQEDGVGRQHAQLVLQNGQTCLEDLDSVNGTFVNKQKLAPHQPMPLKDGDELRMGKMVLIYQAS